MTSLTMLVMMFDSDKYLWTLNSNLVATATDCIYMYSDNNYLVMCCSRSCTILNLMHRICEQQLLRIRDEITIVCLLITEVATLLMRLLKESLSQAC